MRSIGPALGFCIFNLVTGVARGQAPTEPAKPVKPRVYALVAAVGDEFSRVSEPVQTVCDA